MKYRKFGSLNWESSVLGFGVMRLPVPGKDETEIVNMIRYAIDNGVNYLDTGFAYDMKQYERMTRLISKALGQGYREKVKIAATIPSFFVNSDQDFDRYLNQQLEWLQIDKIDFYLIGRLYRENWPHLKDLGVLNWAEGAMADGRIDKLGFSFHDHYQILKSILNDYDNWALCHLQYSYMDIDHDPGVTGLKYAAEKGLAIVVTEALKWGRLFRNTPEPVEKIWKSSSHKRNLLEWGLRWAWNLAEVSVVLNDFSSMDHVKQSLALIDNSEPGNLTVLDEVIFGKVRDAYRKLRPIPCPSCRPCMPCPKEVDAPRIFEIYNDAAMYDDIETARWIYNSEKHNIDNCTECGICEKKCTKGIPIREWLKKARDLLVNDE